MTLISYHRVRQSDQLYLIMRKTYGDKAFLDNKQSLMAALLAANPHITNPDLIFPGHIVALPSLGGIADMVQTRRDATTCTVPVVESLQSANSAALDLMSMFAPEKVAMQTAQTAGVSFAGWVHEASDAAVHDARTVARSYMQYQAGQITIGQYDGRRRVAVRNADVRLNGLRQLITPGQTTSEVLRVNPRAPNRIQGHINEINRLSNIARTAKNGVVVLKAIDIADTANKIHTANSNEERTVILLDQVSSVAGGVAATALVVFLVGTPTGWLALAGMTAVGVAGSLGGEALGKMVMQNALYDETGNRKTTVIDQIWRAGYR
jgi:hypothetical protein